MCDRMEKDVPGYTRNCKDCLQNVDIEFDEISYEIVYLFNVLSGQLRSSFGVPTSLDYSSVEYVFNLYEVPDDLKVFYFEWIIYLVQESIIKPEQKRAKDTADKTKQNSIVRGSKYGRRS